MSGRSQRNATRTGLFYIHSGKIDPKFIFGLPIIASAAIILSFVYSYAVVYIPIIGYLNFILTLGFSFGVAFSTAFMLKFFNNRNLAFAGGVGLLAGLIAVYAAWVIFEFALVNRYSSEKIDLFLLALNPAVVWEIASNIAEEGWYSIRNFTPSGIVLWAFWGIEACCILGVSAYISYNTTREAVFCEDCRKWTDELKGLLTFPFGRESLLEKQIKRQDLSFMESIEALKDGDTTFYRIDCRRCKSCRQLFTMSLVKVARSWDKNGKEETKEKILLQHLLIEKETFQEIRQFARGKRPRLENISPESSLKEGPQIQPQEAVQSIAREKIEHQMATQSSSPSTRSQNALNDSLPQKRYVMLFQGEIADGYQLEDVKENVAALYKIPVSKCERLFRGEMVTIKKNLDRQTVQKYKRAFEKTGALCLIKEMQE